MKDNLESAENRRIAYFSMEIAVADFIPTYSGGLGVLAGDTIRSAADLGIPIVAISLVHRKGYFHQTLSSDGWQSETDESWQPEEYLVEQVPRIEIELEGRSVWIRAWRFDVEGVTGKNVSVFLLDTDLPENSQWDRELTDHLYGEDQHYRLCQEIVLGIGGIRMLKALGFSEIERYHMNEGHSSLLALELLKQRLAAEQRQTVDWEDILAVRKQCVFTTHTPVSAGHDRFNYDLAYSLLGRTLEMAEQQIWTHEGQLNMTFLALNLSHYVNGVARKHGEVSRHMYADYKVDSITNGVHAANWSSPFFQDLFDNHIPGWREDNFSLRYALGIPLADIQKSHVAAKSQLIDHLNQTTNIKFDSDRLLLGFARRATAYKRPTLIMRDMERLRDIGRNHGLQLVFAGKAHPRDGLGKELIHQLIDFARSLEPHVTFAYLPNYDMRLAKLLTAGADVWLNTPQPPMEASGTSGMKAAINGVPSLSVLDGWWIEGCIEGVTGWGIGERTRAEDTRECFETDSCALYEKLEDVVLPLYYQDPVGFAEVMRHSIALNGSFFNTHRMMEQYVMKAYFN